MYQASESATRAESAPVRHAVFYVHIFVLWAGLAEIQDPQGELGHRPLVGFQIPPTSAHWYKSRKDSWKMNNLVPFSFEDHTVRVQTDASGQPWFSANDVCEALEMGNPRDAIERHCDIDDVGKRDTIDNLGRTQQANHINESGLYSLILGCTKESAKRFKRWVTSEVLPSIRKTGSYSVGLPAAKPFNLFPDCFAVAKLIGLDQNAAAISANQAVRKLTGADVLDLLGQTHLIAAHQDGLYFTSTELGERIGLSAIAFNRRLENAGLQSRQNKRWVPCVAEKPLYRILDTGRRHSDGALIQQIKWLSSVVDLVDDDCVMH